jgi:hypothetical protein
MWGEARLGRRRLAQLLWTGDGQLRHEKPLDAEGRGHGLEIQRDDLGKIAWCAEWAHGKQHGLVIQFGPRGRPLLVTEFVRGRGADIWISGCDGRTRTAVTEVRELVDGRLNGWVRWGSPRRPWDEEHFVHGERHGIFRRWEEGSLCKGYPRFYVKDVRVSRRAYEAAQTSDATLPRYFEQDNVNVRALPAVVRDALARAKALRRALTVVEQVRRGAEIRPAGRRARVSVTAPRAR